MFISLVNLVKAHWLSEITAASCKWCVKWKGFAHPAKTEQTSRKLCHWTGLGGKEGNSCDTRRIKPGIYRQRQKINQVWRDFPMQGFFFFFPVLSCSVSFLYRDCEAEWFWFVWLAWSSKFEVIIDSCIMFQYVLLQQAFCFVSVHVYVFYGETALAGSLW